MLDIVKSGWMLFVILISSMFFSALVLICYFPAKWINPNRDFLHRIAGQWASTIVYFIPGWHFRVEGKENLPSSPCMMVANHQSQTDILAVYLTGANFRWLSKDSVFKIPFIGWSMSAVGYVSVERGNRNSHAKCLEDSLTKMKQGVSMLFFPEGTRSEDGKLKSFKSGAFKVAEQAGACVVPIVIQGTHTLLRKHSLIPRSSTITIQILPPIAPNTEANLMQSAHNAIAQCLSRCTASDNVTEHSPIAIIQ